MLSLFMPEKSNSKIGTSPIQIIQVNSRITDKGDVLNYQKSMFTMLHAYIGGKTAILLQFKNKFLFRFCLISYQVTISFKIVFKRIILNVFVHLITVLLSYIKFRFV